MILGDIKPKWYVMLSYNADGNQSDVITHTMIWVLLLE